MGGSCRGPGFGFHSICAGNANIYRSQLRVNMAQLRSRNCPLYTQLLFLVSSDLSSFPQIVVSRRTVHTTPRSKTVYIHKNLKSVEELQKDYFPGNCHLWPPKDMLIVLIFREKKNLDFYVHVKPFMGKFREGLEL